MEETKSWWRDPLGWALALWGGAVAVLGFPPGELWGLAVLAPAPLWAVSVGAHPRRAMARGWLFGLGFFSALLWWIGPTVARYGGLPLVAGAACVALLAAYLALFPALAAAGTAALPSPALALAVAPLLWTGLEGARGWLLTGFPWGDLPQALWRVEGALALAPWVGIDGVRLLLAGLASGFAWLLLRPRLGARLSPWGLVPALAAAGAWVILGVLAAPVPPGSQPLRVAVVQGNIDQAVKWDPAYRQSALAVHGRLSRLHGAGADLVLWPETAVPLYAQDRSAERLGIERLAEELGVHLAFGAPAYERRPGGDEYRNAVFLLGPEGRIEGRYDKVHLVPFGEYVPLGRYLPFLKKLAHGAGDFSPGPGVAPLAAQGLPALGPLICFEVIFPGLGAELATRGAQVLTVFTNDGWFGHTPGPHQHLAFGAWRAAEVGLPLVRAANTGVSAAFDGRGKLVRATDLGVEGGFVLDLPVPLPHRTPQHRVRPWVTPWCFGLAGAALFATLRGPRHRGTD